MPPTNDPPANISGALREFLNAFKDVDNSRIAGIIKVQNAMTDMAKITQDLAKQTSQLEQVNKGLQSQFGLNIKDSTRMGAQLDLLAKKFEVGGDKLRKYIGDLKGLIGGYAGAFSQADKGMSDNLKKMVRTQTIIQNQLKLSGEVANKFTLYSAGVGRSSDELVASYAKMAEQITTSTGYQVSAKELVADTAGLSEDVLMLYGKMPGKLAKATVQAKMLGVTMADLNKIGDNLLNIESSIGQELEYQLLSGRRLIGDQQSSADLRGKSLTNAYREAQLQGDGPKQAKILNQILKQEGKTLEDNLFARKQMAGMLGMDEATLARSLMKQKVLNELQAKGVTSFDEKTILDSKLDDKDKEYYLKKLSEVGDTRTTEEKMADDIESIVTDGIRLLSTPEAVAEAAAARSERLREKGIDVPEQVGKYYEDAGGPAKSLEVGQAVTKNLATKADTAEWLKAWKNVLMSSTLSTPWVVTTTGNVDINGSVDNSGADYAFGGVVPPGFPNDTYPAMLTSGETVIPAGQSAMGDVSLLASAIVTAIKQQTDALTSNSRMNAPYWS